MAERDAADATPARRSMRGPHRFLVRMAVFVVLVAAGIWLLGTMADIQKVQDCAAQGRRSAGARIWA